jgi:hypothetical protein
MWKLGYLATVVLVRAAAMAGIVLRTKIRWGLVAGPCGLE